MITGHTLLAYVSPTQAELSQPLHSAGTAQAPFYAGQWPQL
jgi:hypothetical protein